MDIRVGDVLEIVLTATATDSATHTGKWLINKAFHTMQEGGLSSKYIATRGDFNQPSSRSVSEPDNMAVESGTPGVDFSTKTAPNAVAGAVTINTGGGVITPILLASEQ
jgi:hypothetical protein